MGTGSIMKMPVVNPYVGPRPFTRADASLFFGRDIEARDLLSLVVSEQLVLFYSQSGAGKSSLINTRLVPELEERNFEVLPVGRVSGDILKHGQCDNIFAFNLFTHLEQTKTAPERFARMRLAEFLADLALVGERFQYAAPSAQPPDSAQQLDSGQATLQPRVLILDQFEEIVTTHPEAWEKRADFFVQIAEAMEQDPYLWVVMVMREDYVATLDPFAHLLSNQMRARFYMRRMEYDAALDAVRRPVEKLRPYDAGIAEMLVDNLRILTAASSQAGEAKPVYGEFIEPVQLQVVCYQLWASLMKESDTMAPGKRITQADIDALAKGESLAQFINKALGDFYEQALAKVQEKSPGVVSEHDLRAWFSTQLITEAETRGFVYQGKTHAAGLPNSAVNTLASYYIIRPETRPGGTWFELVHDRFVGPILQSNRAWMEKNQSRLLTDANKWKDANHLVELLYEGNQLEAAQAEILQRGSAITELEKEFVAASERAARHRREARLRLLTVGLVTLFAVLTTLSWWALSSRSKAVQALSTAEAANQVAEQALDVAENARSTVSSQNATAQAQTTALMQQSINQFDSISRLQTRMAPFLVVPTETPQLEPTIIDFPTPTFAQIQNPEFTIIPEATPTLWLTPTPEIALRKIVIGQSVKGRDIVSYQFGKGPQHIVFVGGLHAGYAPSSVTMAQTMIDYLSKNTDFVPPSFTVDIILNANPDSLGRQDLSSMVSGRLNANGVDLNSNWDCNWKQDATWSTSRIPINGGGSAFSEPETKALREYILGNLSVAVVVWEVHTFTGRLIHPGGCGEVSVFSQPLSELYADAAKYTADKFLPYGDSGAMIDWLDSQSIPSISINLPDFNEVNRSDLGSQLAGLEAIIASFSASGK